MVHNFSRHIKIREKKSSTTLKRSSFLDVDATAPVHTTSVPFFVCREIWFLQLKGIFILLRLFQIKVIVIRFLMIYPLSFENDESILQRNIVNNKYQISSVIITNPKKDEKIFIILAYKIKPTYELQYHS
ncbi:hypothetical protein K501DRAFT_278992 [Backusella circina FSU 941]|nr:hypothetical protein K501DRAFT_278992 [Backusella circina FSU 941]